MEIKQQGNKNFQLKGRNITLVGRGMNMLSIRDVLWIEIQKQIECKNWKKVF